MTPNGYEGRFDCSLVDEMRSAAEIWRKNDNARQEENASKNAPQTHRYTACGEVPDRLLPVERPPSRDVDRI